MADAGLGRSPQVDAVPAAVDAQVVEAGLPQLIAEDGVVGRVGDAYACHPDVAAVGDDDGMRPAHALLAERVAHVTAVNGAAARNARMVGIDDMDEGQRPLRIGRVVVVDGAQAGAVTAQVGLRAERLVAVKVSAALDHGEAVEPERHTRRHMDGAGDKDARRHDHPSPTLPMALGQGAAEGRSVVGGTVADGTEREDIDDEN